MYAYVNKWARIVEKLQKNIPQSSAAAGWTKKIFLIWISNSYNGPKSKKKQVETNAKQGKFNLPACQTELPARSNTLMDGWTEWMHGWSDGGIRGPRFESKTHQQHQEHTSNITAPATSTSLNCKTVHACLFGAVPPPYQNRMDWKQ